MPRHLATGENGTENRNRAPAIPQREREKRGLTDTQEKFQPQPMTYTQIAARIASGYTCDQFLADMKASAECPVGSHIARKDGICSYLSRKAPELARAIAEEINANPEHASEVSGMHPDSCRALAYFLTR